MYYVCKLKQWIAILFLSTFILSKTELHQLLKLPVLVQHYFEHGQTDSAISFFVFLKMHYNNPVKDADYQRDMQLPFKSHESHANYSVFSQQIPSFELNKTSYIIQKSFISIPKDFYSSSYIDNIWQPPRRA